MSKSKLNCWDLSNHVWFVMKTKLDNDVTNRISLVYAETKIELSRPIWPGIICDEN